VHSAAIFVFVGVDCNHFLYVWNFEVVVQGLIGDVPGAILKILSIFVWKVWRILVLDGLLHPHSSTPYVQIGRSIAFYTVSLLSRDSCERVFIGQLMFLSLSSSWHLLVFMCVFLVSFSFRWIPRYLTSFSTGMWVLWRFTGGEMSRHVVNVTCVELVGFTSIFHSSSQIWSRLSWCWYISVARTRSGSDDRMSSTNVAMIVSCVFGTSAVYQINYIEHKTNV